MDEPLPAPVPEQALTDLGLRYVSDEWPGISRRRAGKGFAYRDPSGKPIRAANTLKSIPLT